MWAWGGNENGQLGTGPATRIATIPADVEIHLSHVSSTASNVAGLGLAGDRGDAAAWSPSDHGTRIR